MLIPRNGARVRIGHITLKISLLTVLQRSTVCPPGSHHNNHFLCPLSSIFTTFCTDFVYHRPYNQDLSIQQRPLRRQGCQFLVLFERSIQMEKLGYTRCAGQAFHWANSSRLFTQRFGSDSRRLHDVGACLGRQGYFACHCSYASALALCAFDVIYVVFPVFIPSS